jgi:protein-L-isoaspartate(D-aspartate) O-methyltransferase
VQADLAQLREGMVARILAASHVTSGPVTEALRTVPRHVFLPGLPPAAAYRDEAIVTKRDGDGQPISSSSQPAIMAIMLAQLGLEPGHRVLEIGTGTGYNAALMKHLVGASGVVVSIDIDADLTERARANLAAAGYPGVTTVCADGAEGFAAQAPYDRVIATVGVNDLAPAWLAQAAPAARIVVPLDLRGPQRSVAFERADGYWRSRSMVPCGFMRIRGTQAGQERVQVIDPVTRLSVMVPEGRDADGAALAAAIGAALGGPATEHSCGVSISSRQLFDGLSLWLTVNEPRWCALSEEAGAAQAARLARAPDRIQDLQITAAILEGSSLDGTSLAMLAREHPVHGVAVHGVAVHGDAVHGDAVHGDAVRGVAVRGDAVRGDAVRGDAGDGSADAAPFMLSALGYGPNGDALARELSAHVRAWDAAGRPATDGLHVDAYPRPARDPAAADARNGVVIERPHNRFVLYRE